MIRVLIVDDIRLYREGLAYILGRQDGISVVGVAGHRDQSLKLVHEQRPNLVLLRMAMPDSMGMLGALAAAAPEVKVIALGMSDSENEVIACAEASIAGYLFRDGSLDELVATMHSVARGETLCTPRIAATLLRHVAILAAERHSWVPQAQLTPREAEIVKLIDAGQSNKEIARRLSIEVRTVKNHVHNILEKLQVHRRGEAAAWYRGAHRTLDPIPRS